MAKARADIRSLARSHTASAIRTLVAIMREPKSQASARVSAATALLDRGWGKPKETFDINQRITLIELLRDWRGEEDPLALEDQSESLCDRGVEGNA